MKVTSKEREIIENYANTPKLKFTLNWIKKNTPRLASWCEETMKASKVRSGASLWILLYTKDKKRPNCPVCKKPTVWRGDFQVGFGTYCSHKCYSLDKENVSKGRAKTMLETYGVEYTRHNIESEKKRKDTCLSIYGVENPLACSSVHNKTKDSLEKHFGVRSTFLSKEIRKTAKQTMLNRYGFEHTMQVPKFHEQQQKSGFTIRKIKLDGKLFKVRGYETYALKYLVNNGCKVENIFTSSEEGKPSIKYTHFGKDHVYHPDAYAKYKNKWTIIEVKSSYYLGFKNSKSGMFSKTKKKAIACTNAGYIFKLILVLRSKDKMCIEIDNLHLKSRREVKAELKFRYPGVKLI